MTTVATRRRLASHAALRRRGARPSVTAPRRGAVLLTVLWVLVAASVLSLAALLAAREALGTADNRLAAMRALWHAEGCAARARAEVDAAVRAFTQGDARSPWSSIDRLLADAALLRDVRQCQVVARAAGTGADVNELDAAAIGRVLRWLGVPDLRADSMTDALLDWRDADQTARPLGAERAWYELSRRMPPRDGPLADVRELRHVRGFEALPNAVDSALEAAFEVGGARLSLAHASPAALASLPGFGPEAVARVLDLRKTHAFDGTPGREGGLDLVVLSDALTTPARIALAVHATEVASRITVVPDAWHLVALATASQPGRGPAVTVGVELRLVRVGAGTAVTRTTVIR